jgi:hypothetical protein
MQKKRVELDLSERTKTRLRERIRALTPRTWGQSLRSCIERINRYLRGWAEYFGVAYWAGGTARYADGHIRRRLRAILLAQWKGTKTIRANLVRLGTEPALTKRVGRSSGAWKRSNHRAVRMGLDNECFRRWGLLTLDELCAFRFAGGLPLPEPAP